MLYDPGESWTADLSGVLASVSAQDAMHNLLEATVQASACTTAAVFVQQAGGHQRIASAGAPLGELLSLMPVDRDARMPFGAFQIAPFATAGSLLRVRMGGRDLSCFAAASSFELAGNEIGLLVVVDEPAHLIPAVLLAARLLMARDRSGD
jgi:hypothetical protein